MSRAVSAEQMSESILFIGSRSLHSEGMFQLADGYAKNHGLPMFQADERGEGKALPACRFSLVVCCPPCGAGTLPWLATLLTACRYQADHTLVYLDSQYKWRGRLVRQLFCSPICLVYDCDTPEDVTQMIRFPWSSSVRFPFSSGLNRKELEILCGHLQGMSVQAQARLCGLSVKSVYRLRLSGLDKLGLRPRTKLMNSSYPICC